MLEEWCQQDIRNDMPHGVFDLILCRHLAHCFTDLDSEHSVREEYTLKQIPRQLRLHRSKSNIGGLMIFRYNPILGSDVSVIVQDWSTNTGVPVRC